MQFGINQNCYCLASTDAVNKQIDNTKIEGFVKEGDGEGFTSNGKYPLQCPFWDTPSRR